jgi:tetratricopeptide (TPR) repeat protein
LLPAVFGDIALLFGDANHAIALYQDYLARNPLGSNTLRSLGDAMCAAGQLQQCLQARLRLLALHPEYDGINSSVGLARLYLGDLTAAREAMQREPREDYRLRGLAVVDAASGRRAESDAALKTLEEKFASRDPFGIAEVHAYRGEIDDAFRWLDRAYQAHDVGMLGIKTEPLLRSLQSDSRFHALLSRMRLADPPPVMRVPGVEI